MSNLINTETHYWTSYYIFDSSTKDGKPFVNRIADVDVAIYPMDDDAFKDGFADDFFVMDTRTNELLPASKELEAKIIAQIKEERPQEWREIRAMGAANRKAYIDGEKADMEREERREET